MLSKKELLEWQIWFYEKRLSEEIRPEGKRFLKTQLFNLKNKRLC